jgi:hypothetical protein
MTTTTPAVPACLLTPYSAKPNQKGGTLVAEAVESLQEHRRLVCDPDAYRPERCPRCGFSRLHAHDFRDRTLVDERTERVETIRRYQCMGEGCEAVWRILPAVIARHLHRAWETVEAATSKPSCSKLPKTTLRRWLARLQLVATQLTQLLATTAEPVLAITDPLCIACTRSELVAALAGGGVLDRLHRLQQFAGWLHRLEPGVRLM